MLRYKFFGVCSRRRPGTPLSQVRSERDASEVLRPRPRPGSPGHHRGRCPHQAGGGSHRNSVFDDSGRCGGALRVLAQHCARYPVQRMLARPGRDLPRRSHPCTRARIPSAPHHPADGPRHPRRFRRGRLRWWLRWWPTDHPERPRLTRTLPPSRSPPRRIFGLGRFIFYTQILAFFVFFL